VVLVDVEGHPVTELFAPHCVADFVLRRVRRRGEGGRGKREGEEGGGGGGEEEGGTLK
jgi:hypothetical protein